MSELEKIPLEEATQKQLYFYASSILNIEVGAGSNNTALRAKILQAQPDCTEITAKVESPKAEPEAKAAAKAPASGKAFTTHFRDDPKVLLRIMSTGDSTRAKDVQVACQGDVIMIKRDRDVSIPYRHYLVLNDAVEHVARDTDEINPQTGLPIKEWVDQHSYPFQILAMPTNAEIKAWEARVNKMALA